MKLNFELTMDRALLWICGGCGENTFGISKLATIYRRCQCTDLSKLLKYDFKKVG